MNILIGEISSYKAIVICKYLKKSYKDIAIYTYDKHKRSNLIRSKYSDQHFFVDPDYFEKQLQLIIEKYKIDYFFPVINSSIARILKEKDIFGNTLDYVNDIDLFDILNNKISLHKLAYRLGVKAPKTFESIDMAKFPFVVKPSNLSSAVGVKYINNEMDKKRIEKNEKKDCIIQEYVEGVGVGYSFYSKNGVIAHGYGHRRLAEYPVTGGASTHRTYYHNNLMHDVASKIVENLNYTGFAMFEFKLTSDDQLYLLEVNPRIWGSINQGIADGNVNYFEEILGKTTIKRGVKYRKINTYIPLVFASHLGYLSKFRFKPLYDFASNIFINRSDVGLLDDPLGYFSTILRRLG